MSQRAHVPLVPDATPVTSSLSDTHTLEGIEGQKRLMSQDHARAVDIPITLAVSESIFF